MRDRHIIEREQKCEIKILRSHGKDDRQFIAFNLKEAINKNLKPT